MAEQHHFETDISKILDIVTHALYSNTEVFLRELVSNASDACSRLRYEALTQKNINAPAELRIDIKTDRAAKTLTIIDNGIGMNKQDLIDNIGTIARSGTARIMEALESQRAAKSEEEKLSLIGQFGVGFYASFMVANKVEVISRKAGEADIWHWQSEGKDGYSLDSANKDQASLLTAEQGTVIVLHLSDDHVDYLEESRIHYIVSRYSDHIDLPVYLNEGENPLNQANALWQRPKSDVTEEQHQNFYQSFGAAFDSPLLTLHWRAEGVIEYSALLYLPTMRPFDLYDPAKAHNVKLYVKRVLITDNCEGLIYPWLRFVRGVVDSQDLPLNISREMLQTNPVVNKIRSGLTKKILAELAKLAEKKPDDFSTFWDSFGAVVKEGLYDAAEHRDAILKLCRFKGSFAEGWQSLEDYRKAMKDGQDKIYYITGETAEQVAQAPQMEGFKKRGVPVLYMTDKIDPFWLQQGFQYDGLSFQSITQGSGELDKFDDKSEEPSDESKSDTPEESIFSTLIEKAQQLLINDVHNVRLSKRLEDSPVCFVVPDGQTDMHAENIMKIHQNYDPQSKRILELNPKHPLIKSLAERGDAVEEDAIWMLYDQARILQGELPKDPTAFTKRLNKVMAS